MIQVEGLEENYWYLDTRCSAYMIRRKYWFISLDESIKSKVKFADDHALVAEEVGKIVVKTKKGGQASITNVLFVPRMKSNLLSLVN